MKKKIIIAIWVILYMVNSYFPIEIEYYIYWVFNDAVTGGMFTFHELFYYLLTNGLRYLFNVGSFAYLLYVLSENYDI